MLKEILERIMERLDRIEERLDYQNKLICALQHNSEVAKAEREAIAMTLARSGGQLSEISRLIGDISEKIHMLASGQEAIKENLRDQALDITLLKKIVSM
ncbi:MAG: hypothetical protein ACOY30_05570 [Bacillota bacterium]